MKCLKILVFIVFFVLASCSEKKPREALYKSYRSPDGRFTIEVTIEESKLDEFPGMSGDQQGHVKLIDSTGSVLEKKHVEMVNIVEEPRWNKNKVDVKFVAEWELPDIP